MKTPGMILAAAAFALAGAPVHPASPSEENQARLARMLEGRTAGEPVTCIRAFNSNRLEVIEDVALVYNAGSVLYVARPTNPDSLGRNDIVVINRSGGQLCHTDIVRTVDRHSGFTTGVVFLEKFVPYSKQD